MSSVLVWALTFALGCLTLSMMLSTARIIIGPRAEDRVVAFDSLYSTAMLLALSLGLVYRSSSYFEAALLMSLFGFVGSTAISKFLLRGEIIE